MFEIRMFKLNSCPRNLILLTELLANKLKSENLQIWKLSNVSSQHPRILFK